MHCRLRRAFVLAACAFGVTAVAACDLGYGASFDYPSEPPVPPDATVIATAEGWDDDDPLRGREVVIDMGGARHADLVRFYRKQFPSADGWVEGIPDPDVGDHVLCLVSHDDEEFDEYVEIYSYNGGSESAGSHRYLASISRLSVSKGERTVDRCGLAGIWYPIDL